MSQFNYMYLPILHTESNNQFRNYESEFFDQFIFVYVLLFFRQQQSEWLKISEFVDSGLVFVGSGEQELN